MSFSDVAPYLKDPLVLVGFALSLFFGLARSMIRGGVIKPVAGKASYKVLQAMLLYGFLLGTAIAALGFGLKYRELSQAEQRNAISLLRGELDANLATTEQLRLNTVSMLSAMTVVASAIRSPEVPAVSSLFPADNIRAGETRPPAELALVGATALIERDLDKNAVEMARAQELAVAVRRTIDSTRGTVASLGDLDGRRYVISDSVWNSQLPVLRKVMLPGIPQYQASYAELKSVRSDYDAVVKAVAAYLDGLAAFFNRNEPIDLGRLTTMLALERHAFGMAARYGENLANSMERTKALRSQLDGDVARQ